MGWREHADSSYEITTSNPGEFCSRSPTIANAASVDWPLPKRYPRQSTVRQLLKQYLDISCVPRRSFFENIRTFATEEREREKLTEFCSNDGLVGPTGHTKRHTEDLLLNYRTNCFPTPTDLAEQYWRFYQSLNQSKFHSNTFSTFFLRYEPEDFLLLALPRCYIVFSPSYLPHEHLFSGVSQRNTIMRGYCQVQKFSESTT